MVETHYKNMTTPTHAITHVCINAREYLYMTSLQWIVH